MSTYKSIIKIKALISNFLVLKCVQVKMEKRNVGGGYDFMLFKE